MVSKNKSPLDAIRSIRIGDLIDWARANKLAAAAILGFGGMNLVPTRPAEKPDPAAIIMTAAEYSTLIQGMIDSCRR